MDDLWAKSDGETLLDHTSHVMAVAERLCHMLPFPVGERNRLAETLKRIAALHDLGKAATGFQKALHEDLGWGHRHEILSTAYAALWLSRLTAPELLAILTHHRSLPEGASPCEGERCLPHNELPYDACVEWQQMKEEFQQNRTAIERFSAQIASKHGEAWTITWNTPTDFGILDKRWVWGRKFQNRIPPEERRFASLLRGLLITSDHMASGHIPVSTIPTVPLLERYRRRIYRKELKGGQLLPFQERCEHTQGCAILKAPTGSGKTLAIFLWAAHNQNENGRFYYALPHTASLNAMHQRLRRIFGVRNCGIAHYKNAAYLFRLLEGDRTSVEVEKKIQKAKTAKKLANLAREMYFPIRATTPHQLLRGALKGQGWELALSEFPNACFVFDEIHAFEPLLFGLTVAMAKWLQTIGAKLLFASATLPKFAEDVLCEHLKIPKRNIISPRRSDPLDAQVLNKKRHQLKIQPGTIEDYLPEIINYLASSNKSVLVVCNHVRTSQSVFSQLADEFKGQAILLHARFNSEDRNRIERDITSDDPPRILVATQAVEVSLDLDYDTGFIEPAPIDALGQRFGRINRRGKAAKPAPIVIFAKAVGGELYDEVLTQKTVEALRGVKTLSEQRLTQIVDAVYEEGYPAKSQERFEQGLNNSSLRDFDQDIVAGTHRAWLENILEKADGQVELLPFTSTDEKGRTIDMLGRYRSLIKSGRYLEARQLLVPVRIGQFFALKSKHALQFDEELREWKTTQKYSTVTGLDLDHQMETFC